jgi:hypothetical protein
MSLDDLDHVRPVVMSEATLAFRRLLERFGKRTEKLGHLHHTGTILTSAGDGWSPDGRGELRVRRLTRSLARCLTPR